MRDIRPGDEVVVLGTGEHGFVEALDWEPQAFVAIDGAVIALDLGDIALAGEEAP